MGWSKCNEICVGLVAVPNIYKEKPDMYSYPCISSSRNSLGSHADTQIIFETVWIRAHDCCISLSLRAHLSPCLYIAIQLANLPEVC